MSFQLSRMQFLTINNVLYYNNDINSILQGINSNLFIVFECLDVYNAVAEVHLSLLASLTQFLHVVPAFMGKVYKMRS